MKTPLSSNKLNSELIKNKFNTPIHEKKESSVFIKSELKDENTKGSPTFNTIINSPTLLDSPNSPDNTIKKLNFNKNNEEKIEFKAVKKEIIKESEQNLYDSPIPDELFELIPIVYGEVRKIKEKPLYKKADTPLKMLQKKASQIFSTKPSAKNLLKKGEKKTSKNSIIINSDNRKSSKMVKKAENNGLKINDIFGKVIKKIDSFSSTSSKGTELDDIEFDGKFIEEEKDIILDKDCDIFEKFKDEDKENIKEDKKDNINDENTKEKKRKENITN